MSGNPEYCNICVLWPVTSGGYGKVFDWNADDGYLEDRQRFIDHVTKGGGDGNTMVNFMIKDKQFRTGRGFGLSIRCPESWEVRESGVAVPQDEF